MEDSNKSQNVAHLVKSPLNFFRTSFGSLTLLTGVWLSVTPASGGGRWGWRWVSKSWRALSRMRRKVRRWICWMCWRHFRMSRRGPTMPRACRGSKLTTTGTGRCWWFGLRIYGGVNINHHYTYLFRKYIGRFNFLFNSFCTKIEDLFIEQFSLSSLSWSDVLHWVKIELSIMPVSQLAFISFIQNTTGQGPMAATHSLFFSTIPQP